MANTRALNLFEEARLMPDGDAKLELLEEAIRLAAEQNHTDLVHAAREILMDTASFSGHPEKTLETFRHYLAEFDKAPHRRDSYQLLWRFKWALHHLRDFPNISWQTIESMLEDFKMRLLAGNHSLRPFYYQKLAFELHAGKVKEAKQLFEKWQTSPRDDLADCLACESHQKVLYHLTLKQLSKAIEEAQPLLKQELGCYSVPQNTFAALLRAMLEANNLEAAQRLHNLNYETIKASSCLAEIGHHLLYLSLTHDLQEASELVKEQLPKLIKSQALEAKFYFLLGLDAYCQSILTQKKLELNLPEELESIQDAHSLAHWCKEQLEHLTSQFDTRNQSNAFASRFRENTKLIRSYTRQH